MVESVMLSLILSKNEYDNFFSQLLIWYNKEAHPTEVASEISSANAAEYNDLQSEINTSKTSLGCKIIHCYTES